MPTAQLMNKSKQEVSNDTTQQDAAVWKMAEVTKSCEKHLMWVQDHPRSSNLSPSERAYVTSY